MASAELSKRATTSSLMPWYIEPYAQISYARYNSVDYKLKNGLHTKDDGSTHWVWKAV
jgi:outer membrane autotransporter protein